jgi:MFS superfamily sulfate permease-like transporter
MRLLFISKEIKMRDTIITQVTDTLTKKPEYGIISSMLSITMSATDFLQLIGIILGLFIAVITATLKVIELKDKIRDRRENNKRLLTNDRRFKDK